MSDANEKPRDAESDTATEDKTPEPPREGELRDSELDQVNGGANEYPRENVTFTYDKVEWKYTQRD